MCAIAVHCTLRCELSCSYTRKHGNLDFVVGRGASSGTSVARKITMLPHALSLWREELRGR